MYFDTVILSHGWLWKKQAAFSKLAVKGQQNSTKSSPLLLLCGNKPIYVQHTVPSGGNRAITETGH